MPCFSPLKGYVSKDLTVNGKRKTVFDSRKAGDFGSRTLPCGQCIGCRLERSRQWAVRISQEASLYKRNCFITLTYSPENLPADGSLDVRHYQLFMKRLRKAYPNDKIRFFHCGEYGENLGRPHYHACLLNFDFPDKIHYRTNERGEPLYRSQSLEKIWGLGICEIGSVTFDSAAYVARYITKKVSGPMAEAHYNGRNPEYTTMSRKPGIGKPWLDKFKNDVYAIDAVIMRGKKCSPPRFYNTQFELTNPDEFAAFKHRCDVKYFAKYGIDTWDSTMLEESPERLQVKEKVLKATIKASLGRKYEQKE